MGNNNITGKINTNPISMLVDLMIMFTVSTLLQSLMDKIAINKILGAFIVILALYICMSRLKQIQFILLGILFFCLAFSMLESNNIIRDVTEWIYALGTIFILLMLWNEQNFRMFMDKLEKKIYLISYVNIFGCFLILALLITKVGYISKWGEGTYFVGLCNEAHTMASVACLLLSFIFLRCTMIKKRRMYYVILSFIPIYAILETGARIFLLPAVLFLILIIRIGINNRRARLVTYIIGAALFVLVMLRTSMIEKFIYSFNTEYSTGMLDAFTSGRSRFWQVDIEYFLSGNTYQILFGRSFSAVCLINKKMFGISIGAHNDVIYLLNGTGMVGTFIYVYMCIKVLLILKKRINRNIAWLMCCAYMIVPMLMNGFFTYPHYVYSFVVLYAAICIISFQRPQQIESQETFSFNG